MAEARRYTFDGGALTIDVPAGALPSGIELSATQRQPEDRPPELADIQMRGTFYRLEPDGLTFNAPVTITRRVAVADTGFDLATDGLPLITLALRTSDGAWSWLDNQSIVSDGEFVYVSGEATHTSQILGFGGANEVRWEWSAPGTPPQVIPDDWQLPETNPFFIDLTVNAPPSAASPPSGVWLGRPRVEQLLEQRLGDRWLFSAPVSGGWRAINVEPGDDRLFPDELAAGAMRGTQEFACLDPGPFAVFTGLEVSNIGAGSPLWDMLGLAPPATSVLFGAAGNCVEPATVPTPTAGCVIVVHDQLGTFISYLRMELDFGAGRLRRVEVRIRGAHNNRPVVGELTDAGYWELVAGLNEAGPKRIQLVEVTTEDGAVHDVTDSVRALLGDDGAFVVPYPADPTFGTCPGQ